MREQDQVWAISTAWPHPTRPGAASLEMLKEFDMSDMDELAEFIFDRTRQATMTP